MVALQTQLKSIAYGSDAYRQAARIRYRLFYQAHDISFESIFDAPEDRDLHLAIVERSSNCVLAYGRLRQHSFNEFQIYQMVVLPEFQGQGLGARILQGLTAAAIDRGAALLRLDARVEKVPFYQKFGFESFGNVFPSSMTGVPHIRMQKKIAQ
ncbi:GNAT family N-acetyltransferase [Altericista sp. CCNU0014]|uniref:GNAT family N-acetyltransferase n=1 Tax=Altericista sp. CCNU0014 TaxID=3082949 RepID=UPI00384F52F7